MNGWDLHLHTSMSDGSLSPEEVVAEAERLNVLHIAVTDHDCITGVQAAQQAGGKLGVTVYAGIEISVETSREIHILGYCINPTNGQLLERLDEMQEFRRGRAARMVERLKRAGLELSMDDVLAAAQGKSVGRPHVAHALMEKGYVANIDEAFAKYLKRGAIGYEPRQRLSLKQALDMIHQAGGFSCLAHPVFCGDHIRGLVQELKELGLTAIEAFYPAHTDAMTEFYEKLAKENGLYVTCGSDFHGKNRPGVDIGGEKRESTYLQKSLKHLFCKNE